jgi:hypothetical protein
LAAHVTVASLWVIVVVVVVRRACFPLVLVHTDRRRVGRLFSTSLPACTQRTIASLSNDVDVDDDVDDVDDVDVDAVDDLICDDDRPTSDDHGKIPSLPHIQ